MTLIATKIKFYDSARNYQSANRRVLPGIPSSNKKKEWKPNTILIAGDSTLNGIQENRMSKSGLFKVRAFPGARVNDLYNYLEPLLEKHPSKIIIQAGTNDVVDKSSKEIVDDLINLRNYLLRRIPTCTVIL